jgi:endonuclease YncB( thermonuclease family)
MRAAPVLMLAAVAAGAYALRPHGHGAALQDGSGSFSCSVWYVHDGDTFRCQDGTRVRVAGIDARETDRSCAPGHPCASAPPEEATAALKRLVEGQTLTCEANGTTYDRIAAFCRRSDGVDVSCAMMASGTVTRWDRYWRGHSC